MSGPVSETANFVVAGVGVTINTFSTHYQLMTAISSAGSGTVSPESVTANFTEDPTLLTGVISSKKGPESARQWTFLIINTGPGTANQDRAVACISLPKVQP